MRILISGICGFAGSTIAEALLQRGEGHTVIGFDNFIRPGSEINRGRLKRLGAQVRHADVRSASDIESLPAADWVIDAAANPSVLAGVDGASSSRQVVEHNLGGTVNLLEYCKARKAGFILLSTSRVYSIPPLASLAVVEHDGAFVPDPAAHHPQGVRASGIDETFSTEPPVSLYGATKVASESLALEYGESFGFPVLVNRCGVLAGAGQFGRPDQGIFAYWINCWLRRRPLRYLGFGGSGLQVRDCLHPRDIVAAIERQMQAGPVPREDRVIHLSGGAASAMSLRQLSGWCAKRFGSREVIADGTPRPFDLPWIVLDSARAQRIWNWRPATPVLDILEEIAGHAEANEHWLDLSAS